MCHIWHTCRRKVNECGTGMPSDPSEPFTPIAPTSEVTSFRLSKLTDTSIEINWRQPADIGAAGIGDYLIQQQILPGKIGQANAEDAKGTHFREKIVKSLYRASLNSPCGIFPRPTPSFLNNDA